MDQSIISTGSTSFIAAVAPTRRCFVGRSALASLAHALQAAVQGPYGGCPSTFIDHVSRYPRGRTSGRPVRGANAAAVVAGARRTRRRNGFSQAGNAAADRIVQISRRLQQAVV